MTQFFQVLSIVIFKSNGLGEHYLNQKTYKSYWTVWAKEIGITIQLLPLLIVVGVAIIQIGRYLYSGPPSICKVSKYIISTCFYST